jgi:CubicO group peptidase (beta-lactamase class C family)
MKTLLLITCNLAMAVVLQAQVSHMPTVYPLYDKDINPFSPINNTSQPNDNKTSYAEMTDKSIGSSSPYLDSIISSYMTIDHIPGLSACIVKDNQIAWIGTYRYANFETNTLVDTTTLFHLASVSKTFTVTALMQLWENNYFELDEDINNHLPFEVRNPGYPTDPITFRQLCTHRSTIKDNWSIMPYFWGMDCPIPLDQYLFDYLNPAGALYNPNLNYFSTHQPGTFFTYSNIAVALMGLLVEEMSGIPFSQYTNDSIFTPLGMNETAWFLSEIDTTHMARPYHWNGTNYIPYIFYSYPDYPDGMLKTSVDQLARLLLCYLGQGSFNNTEILYPSTIDSILNINYQGSNFDMGLIWFRINLYPFGLVWGHDGGEYGFRTIIEISRDHNIGSVVLTNGEEINNLYGISSFLLQYALDSILTTHCLPEGITFTTQAEIDSFQTNYPGCIEIEGDVTINGNNISGLDGIDVITKIGGDLTIVSNDVLTSLTGLANLKSIGGDLLIAGNTILTILTGMDSITPGTINDLSIFGNPSLCDCDVLSICQYLSVPNGTIDIHDNAPGCNNQLEVQEDCDSITFIGELIPENTFIISPNPLESATLITYTLRQNSPVALKILDLSGREMATFVYEDRRQGEQKVVFNTSGLPAGVYFCVLKTNEGVQTKKMIKL